MKKSWSMVFIFFLWKVTIAEMITASIDDDPVKGEKDAPVIILEFSDYECPACRKFALTTMKEIEERYIQRGLVKFVFRDYPIPFHPFAREAAKAANCAGKEGRYWEMYDLLFSEGALHPPALREYATSLGLDAEKFERCMKEPAAEEEIKKDMEDAKAYGIGGTPFFIIGQNTGGRKFEGEPITGAQPFEKFTFLIEKYMKLPKIHFPSNQFSLSSESKKILTKHALWLKKHPDVKVVIEGHTDERGSEEYNMKLGLKRAESARDFLLKLGIEPFRMEVVSYGEKRPIDISGKEASFARNRRVEFLLQVPQE